MPQLPCQRLCLTKRHHSRRLLGHWQASPTNGRWQRSELPLDKKHLIAILLRRKKNWTNAKQIRIHLSLQPCHGTLRPASPKESQISARPSKHSIHKMHQSIHQNPASPNPQTKTASISKQTQTSYPHPDKSNQTKQQLKRSISNTEKQLFLLGIPVSNSEISLYCLINEQVLDCAKQAYELDSGFLFCREAKMWRIPIRTSAICLEDCIKDCNAWCIPPFSTTNPPGYDRDKTFYFSSSNIFCPRTAGTVALRLRTISIMRLMFPKPSFSRPKRSEA